MIPFAVRLEGDAPDAAGHGVLEVVAPEDPASYPCGGYLLLMREDKSLYWEAMEKCRFAFGYALPIVAAGPLPVIPLQPQGLVVPNPSRREGRHPNGL